MSKPKQSSETIKKYQPISCIFYDYLEADATLGKVSEIKFKDKNGVTKRISGVIKNLRSINGEEFLYLEDQNVLRLDAIVEFNGLTPESACKI